MTSPRTLLGPLTTTWKPPAVCSYYMATCDTCTTAWQGQTCNPSSNAHDWTDCWPPRSSALADPGVFMGWGFYSPGIACPDGFTTAAMATAGGSTGWGIEYSMEPGETAAACCPTGFTCSSIETLNTYAQTCVLTVTSASFSTVQCNSGVFSDFNAVTFPRTAGGGVQSSFVLFAPLIQLNFKESDAPPRTAGASPGATGTTGSPGATGTTGNPGASQTFAPGAGDGSASGQDPGASPSSSGLSTGAKVGIGIGAAIGAIILAVLALLLYRAWQRRRQTKVIAEGEAARDKMWPAPKQAELGGQAVQELEGSAPAGGFFRRLSSKRRKPPPGPVFTVAPPSMARGSVPPIPGPGPFELEADSPTASTPRAATPRPQTPVILAPAPISPTTPRHSREIRHDEAGPVTPTAPLRLSRESRRTGTAPVTPTTPRFSREARRDEI